MNGDERTRICDVGATTPPSPGSIVWTTASEDPLPERRLLESRVDTPTILIVDDDPDMRLYLNGCLLARGSPARRVLEAGDGLEAIRLIRSEEVALVISDVLLPGMDGLALRRAIRRDPFHASIPILLVSGEGRGPPDMDIRDGFLAKPFNARQLIVAVNRLLVAP